MRFDEYRCGESDESTNRHPLFARPDSRLRCAVHPAHRAPRARAGRVLRNPALGRHQRRRPQVEAQGHHPLGRSRVGHRQGTAARAAGRCSSSAFRCSASATACRPWRSSWAAACFPATIANSAMPKSPRSRLTSCSTVCSIARTRGPRRARRVDEPRRPGGVAAARLHRRGAERQRTARRHGRRIAHASTPCSSIPKSRTRCRASSCSSASCARSAAARRCGAWATSSKTPSRACARRWARARCCSASPAASIPRWSPRCCTRPSATS